MMKSLYVKRSLFLLFLLFFSLSLSACSSSPKTDREKIVESCAKSVKADMKNPDALKLMSDVTWYTFDQHDWENPYNFIVFYISSTNSYGATVTDHYYFYVSPDGASYKYIGNNEQYSMGINAPSKELGQMYLFFELGGMDALTNKETFPAIEVASWIGCDYSK